MKKFSLLLYFLALTSVAFAQNLSYTQLQNVFAMWKQGKGNTTTVIDRYLKANSPKWKRTSSQPLFTDSKEEKYYLWTFLDFKKDTIAMALYIEEDATTIKYTLSYAFHDPTTYNSLVQSLKASSYYYNGKINKNTNYSTGESTLLALPDENLPISKRIDVSLTDYNINNKGSETKLYSVDILSRIIPKNTF